MIKYNMEACLSFSLRMIWMIKLKMGMRSSKKGLMVSLPWLVGIYTSTLVGRDLYFYLGW